MRRSRRRKAISPGIASQLVAAERDVKRFNELIGKGATTQVNVDNAKTAADTATATIQADQAILDNLKVQKSYTLITAPISGRISAASVKVGNFVRPADTSPLATINQMAPVYVTFAIPQRVLSDLRDAMKAGQSSVMATIPGNGKSETGTIAMVENTVDATTGMVTVRGMMGNESELLWPGILVNTRLTVRTEERGHRAVGRRPAQPDREFRVRGQGRQGAGPARYDRPHISGHFRDRQRSARRRRYCR